MLQFFIFFGKHHFECLSFIVQGLFRQTRQHFLRKFPLTSIKQLVDLLLLAVQNLFGLAKVLFSLVLQVEHLKIAVKIIPDVLEKCIEVLLDDLMLTSEESSPLNDHIVESYVELVKSA